jgi:hypothetical protein
MLEEVYFAPTMIYSMVHAAVFDLAIISRCRAHKLVHTTRMNGINMSSTMDDRVCQASTAWCGGVKKRTSHGFLKDEIQHLLMMILQKINHSTPTTFHLQDSTVWRPSVLHVVWSLHGQSLPSQNLQQRFSTSWTLYSQSKILAQTMSALTKLAWFCAGPSMMGAGLSGRRPLGSLWIPITTSITGFKTTHVANGAILLH